jgi:hypothetical protein
MTGPSQCAQRESGQVPLIIGDFGPGAYGPTIMLIPSSLAAVVWFEEILRELGSGGPPKMLTSDDRVYVAHLDEIEMTARSSGLQ